MLGATPLVTVLPSRTEGGCPARRARPARSRRAPLRARDCRRVATSGIVWSPAWTWS
jgi:hypothetical protein